MMISTLTKAILAINLLKSMTYGCSSNCFRLLVPISYTFFYIDLFQQERFGVITKIYIYIYKIGLNKDNIFMFR